MATKRTTTTSTAADETAAAATEAEAVDTQAAAVDDAPADTSVDTEAGTVAEEGPRSTLVEPSAEGLMSEADAPAQSADAPAVAEEDRKGKVPIKLANPIENEEHQRRLRLPVKPGGYNVHDVVWVTPDDARAIINAGLAQVDPEDTQAVIAAQRGQLDSMRA